MCVRANPYMYLGILCDYFSIQPSMRSVAHQPHVCVCVCAGAAEACRRDDGQAMVVCTDPGRAFCSRVLASHLAHRTHIEDCCVKEAFCGIDA